MTTTFEKIIIAVFAFSLVTAMLNASGVFGNEKLPDADISYSSAAKIEELTASPKVQSGTDFLDSITGPIKLLLSVLGFLKELVVSTLNLPGLLKTYGIPDYVSLTLIYPLLALSAIFMFLKWKAGRA